MKISKRLEWAAACAQDASLVAFAAVQVSVARLRWVLFPKTTIVAHLHDGNWTLHPWGTKWRLSGGRLVCPHCNSMHPLEWLDVATENVRWTPSSSWAETKQLIERGELDDNIVNRHRALQIPDGSARFMFIPGFASTSARDRLVVETGDAIYSLAADHIGELMDDDFEEFQVWFSENMPEISIHRHGASVCVHYDPSTSPEPITAAGSCNHNHNEE